MSTKFNIGDEVQVTGNVKFKGDTGEVVDLGQNADFVVVQLHTNGEKRSFHSSDLSFHEEDDASDHDESYFAFYSKEDDSYWVGKLVKADTDRGERWTEVKIDPKSERDFGHGKYMSYLSKIDLKRWLEKDYGRHHDVLGPFQDQDDARDYVRSRYGLSEGVIAEAKKSFKPGDKVHIAYAVKGGSGVFGTLEKIEGEYAYVKSKVDGREKTYKGHANLLSDGKVEESAVSEEAFNEWLELYSQLGEEAFEVFENKRLSLRESEVLQRMLKHVSDKQDFRNLNSHSDLDYAAVSDAKKVSAGKKKEFGGINYKNDTFLMRALLDRAASSKRKIERQTAKYDKVNKDETAGKMPTTKVNLDKYRDYLKRGKSIKGGRAGTGFGGSASFSDDGNDDGGGDAGGVGESFVPVAPPHIPKDRAFKKFYNFLHHMAEEEFPACKVIHIEPSSDNYQTIEFHVECRDDPRKEGFQKDLTDKLQIRLDKHPIPGLGVVNCKVIHAHPKQDHIAK